MKIKRIVFYIATSFIVMGCSPGNLYLIKKSANNENFNLLKQKIDERFNDSSFSNAHWGVLIKSLKTDKIWYEKNPNKLFIPASNEKILTAAAALITLGPDFTFSTYLNYEGDISDSILNGNLVVFSDGDPTMNNNFYNEPTEVFQSWADILKTKGIKQINGNVIGDDDAFEDNPYGKGWSVDDLDEGYAPAIGALQLNENNIKLKIFPPLSVDEKIRIEPDISTGYYSISDKSFSGDTGTTNITVSRSFYNNTIFVEGYIKTESSIMMRTLSILNPTLFYATVLKETLERNGIRIVGIPEDCDDIPGWKSKIHDLKIIELHKSPPLKEILKIMMKQSENLYAETLTRVMGWKEVGIGSFNVGKKIVENVIKQFGAKSGSYAYMDGSGLSRYDLVSPEIITRILEKMIKSNFSREWYEIFPIAGIDGTLKNRMNGTKAEGNVRAKTGTMSNVRGLSGYITTSGGEELIFSFLVNGYLRTTKETENITDGVLEMISEFDGQNL